MNDDTTIFNNNNQQSDNVLPTKPGISSLQQQPVQSPAPQETPPPLTPNIPPTVGSLADSGSGFPFGLIIKIAIGVIILLVIGFLAFFFSGMGGKKTNEKITLTYWGLWEDKAVMQDIITQFQKENPTITVDYIKQDIKQYRERLTTRTQNGTGPDIFRFHNSWIPELRSILLPLSRDVISKTDFQKTYYPIASQDLIQNGAIYGIPLSIDTLALFVNQDIFRDARVEVPTTWDEFAKTARALTVKDETGKIKTAGAAIGTFQNINHAPDLISLLLVQSGVSLKKMSDASKNAADALSFYTSFAIGDGSVWDNTLDPSLIGFAKGNVAMYFGYSWDVLTIKAINPTLVFQTYPVPHLPGRDMAIASYWVEGVSSRSKHPKAAFLFMQFLTKKETEQKLFAIEAKTRLFGEPYARIDLASSVKDNVLLAPFLNQAPNALSTFFVGDTYDNGLNSQMNTYLGNAINAILNGTSTESILETLVQGVNQVMQQYGMQ